MLIESPINYMGSKYKLLDRLIPLFPKTKNFIDLFSGGGSVYMNVADMYDSVVSNEYIFGIHSIQKNLQNESFIQEAKNQSLITKDSQESYLRLRDAYNTYQEYEKLLALIWSCNSNMMRFNNNFAFNQTWGKRCFNKNTQKKLDILSKKDFSNVLYTSVSFQKVLIPEDSFIYLDPPYSNTEAGYNAIWSSSDEEELMRYLGYLVASDIKFGISGVINGKLNRVYEYLKDKDLEFHYFEDMYQKISKKEKVNQEYYITNIKTKRITQ
jgi:DNA adenine methylase Dam